MNVQKEEKVHIAQMLAPCLNLFGGGGSHDEGEHL